MEKKQYTRPSIIATKEVKCHTICGSGGGSATLGSGSDWTQSGSSITTESKFLNIVPGDDSDY